MRQRRAVIFVVVLAFLATACGTRLKDSAFTAAATKGGSGVNGTGSSDQSVVAGDQAGTDQSATGTNGTGTNGTGTGTNGTGTGTAGGTNTGTGGTGGAGNTASDVGVTATSIKVGISIFDPGAFRYLGDLANVGDIKQQWEANVDQWHRQGLLPVNGRDLDLVFDAVERGNAAAVALPGERVRRLERGARDVCDRDDA